MFLKGPEQRFQQQTQEKKGRRGGISSGLLHNHTAAVHFQTTKKWSSVAWNCTRINQSSIAEMYRRRVTIVVLRPGRGA